LIPTSAWQIGIFNPVSDELTVAAISTDSEDKKVVDPSIKIAFEIKIYNSIK